MPFQTPHSYILPSIGSASNQQNLQSQQFAPTNFSTFLTSLTTLLLTTCASAKPLTSLTRRKGYPEFDVRFCFDDVAAGGVTFSISKVTERKCMRGPDVDFFFKNMVRLELKKVDQWYVFSSPFDTWDKICCRSALPHNCLLGLFLFAIRKRERERVCE